MKKLILKLLVLACFSCGAIASFGACSKAPEDNSQIEQPSDGTDDKTDDKGDEKPEEKPENGIWTPPAKEA